ncbi:MAG: hypothetical protein K1X53_16200 [Candidatus Sumerlaeaceae bacterium]|nr:hypothetical protein [Candidatus Sumerlaeaceae bacterium]
MRGNRLCLVVALAVVQLGVLTSCNQQDKKEGDKRSLSNASPAAGTTAAKGMLPAEAMSMGTAQKLAKQYRNLTGADLTKDLGTPASQTQDGADTNWFFAASAKLDDPTTFVLRNNKVIGVMQKGVRFIAR